MKKTIFVSLALILLVSSVFAQDNLGARPMGMGGAFAGLADDANAIFSNPAGIGTLGRETAIVSSRILKDHEYSMIGGVQPTPYGNFGVGYVGSTDIIEGDPGASSADASVPTNYSTQTLYISYARDLSQTIRVPENLGKLALGVNLKLSSRRLGMPNGLSTDGGPSVDMDFATIFRPNDYLSLGLTLQNFVSGGSAREIENLNTVEERKARVLFGASGKLLCEELTWTLEGDNLGCEAKFVEGFALRAGRGKDSFTSGFGININGFCVDYAHQQNSTGAVQYVSVSIIPQGSKEAPVQKAAVNLE